VHARRMRSSGHKLKYEALVLDIRKKYHCAESKILEQRPQQVLQPLPIEVFKMTLLCIDVWIKELLRSLPDIIILRFCFA